MLSALLLSAQAAPALIPLPQKVVWQEGAFRLQKETPLLNMGANSATVARLREALGQPFPAGKAREAAIVLRKVDGMPDEAYRLNVDARTVEVQASTDAGLFYGIQTLRQLNRANQIAACRIEDAPRFGWRGLMLDSSRHFFDVAFVRKFIDRMAAHKLNTFHWHLTDDGGWRMESKRYPKLTEVGAWRREQGTEWDYGNLWFPGPKSKEKLYGGFYSQRQIQDMIRYAKDRNVTIVPEIEMPGHSLAAAAAYPELQCDAPNKGQYLRDTRSQAPTMICPGKDSTLEFYKRVLDETIALFPSQFIHIGADEVDKTLWTKCPSCQARMKANGLKDEHELQSWFVRQMDTYIASKGRRLVGWDEILEGGLAKGATVMSWRGIQGGIAAAKAGQNVVMSPTSHCYFDYTYDAIPTSHVYSYDPIPKELVGDERSKVLGGQGNVWTEYLSTPAEVESMAYPRAVALAETLWTQPDRKSWPDFERRLNAHYVQLANMDIAFRLPSPVIEPTVLNQGVEREWIIPASTFAGTSLVFNGIKVGEGARVIPPIGEYKFVYQLPNGRQSDPTMARVVHLRPADDRVSGYVRRQIAWKGDKTPALSAFATAPRQILRTLSLEGTPTDNPFALLFEFDLPITKKGRHTLTIGSDDGSVLYLDGQKVLENDGPHGYVERGATIDLEPGVYRAQITFFDAGGAKRLEMKVGTP